MKKIAVLLILVVLCMMTISNSFAHNMDVFTDEELKALNLEVQEELIKRGLSEQSTISTGYYTVGIDFPVGSYLITFFKTQSYPRYAIYVSMNEKEPSIEGYIESQTLRISLPEGYVLYLEGVEQATIEKLEPLFSD